MSAETMLSFLERCTPEERLGFQVVTQCAPVLKDVKVSNLIRVRPGGWRQICRILRKSRVICIPLYMDGEKEIVFLYRRDRLQEHLNSRKIQSFLEQYGYHRFEVETVLRILRQHYQCYMTGVGEFPHELGVLLEYPVEDVEGFIINHGENSLAARYWKVYHDPGRAERIFQLYDRVKEQAQGEIINGYPLCQVAVS